MQTEGENKRQKANEQLINWSKWLITINMFAATGCTVALKTGAESAKKMGVFFFAAILSFCISIIFSTLFVFLLAVQNLQAQLSDTPKFIWMSKMQWTFFTIGLLFVLVWIAFLSGVL